MHIHAHVVFWGACSLMGMVCKRMHAPVAKQEEETSLSNK